MLFAFCVVHGVAQKGRIHQRTDRDRCIVKRNLTSMHGEPPAKLTEPNNERGKLYIPYTRTLTLDDKINQIDPRLATRCRQPA